MGSALLHSNVKEISYYLLVEKETLIFGINQEILQRELHKSPDIVRIGEEWVLHRRYNWDKIKERFNEALPVMVERKAN